jgi:aldose 1-epimerase
MLNPKKNPYYGATCGRVAGRIDTACFSLPNGDYVNLAANDGPNSLHGGEMGFSRVMWPDVTIIKEQLLSIVIPAKNG